MQQIMKGDERWWKVMKDDAAEEPPELASLQPLVDAWCGEMGQVMMNGRWMGWCLAIFME